MGERASEQMSFDVIDVSRKSDDVRSQNLRKKLAQIRERNVGVEPETMPRVAEFFAGIGLMRAGLEQSRLRVVWANDIDQQKAALYTAHFGGRHLRVGDIATITGGEVPDVDLATASFPCTDLSLAGERAGLSGNESGTFWEFARILDEMGRRRPKVVLLENVIGFATSRGGKDLVAAVRRLNGLGYGCDVLTVDARHFVPQSRPRLFVVGTLKAEAQHGPWNASETCPPFLLRFFEENHRTLNLIQQSLPRLPSTQGINLSSVVERLPLGDAAWWDKTRIDMFIGSLSELQRSRLKKLIAERSVNWRTAYRRTRGGVPVWEIRADAIAGCLRTTRGGSSKQAIVEAGGNQLRVRWMTPLEYAHLQGAPDFTMGRGSNNPAFFGFGDAVCVPVVEWIARNHLLVQLGLGAPEPNDRDVLKFRSASV